MIKYFQASQNKPKVIEQVLKKLVPDDVGMFVSILVCIMDATKAFFFLSFFCRE